MIKILDLTANSSGAISFYRSRLPFAMLQKDCPEIEVIPYSGQPMTWDFVILFNIIFVKSPYKQADLDNIKLAKKLGVKIIVDVDDYIFEVPGHIAGASEFNNQKTQDIAKECMWLADQVWVSTETLAGYLKYEAGVGTNVHVIRNAYEPLIFNKAPDFNKTQNLLHRGSYAHMEDIQDFADDLVEVANENEWHADFLGLSPLFLRKFHNAKYHDFRSVVDYISYLPTLRCSINIIMLNRNSPYSMCHSNNGWIEGTYAGAVTLAPDVSEWHRPGIVNYGSDFKEKLKAMITGEYDLESLHKQSWQFIQENCQLKTVNQLRIKLVQRLMHSQYQTED